MTDHKLWYFGRSMRKHPVYKNYFWEDIINDDEFLKIEARLKLNAYQVKCIEIGFSGKSIDDINGHAGKFPFGVHKDKRFEDVPERYIVWCSKQNWLDKWPTVKDYVNKFMRERDGGLSVEEMKTILYEGLGYDDSSV